MLRACRSDDLSAMAEYAASQQLRPDRHVVYLATDPDGLAAEVAEVGDWERYGVILEDEVGRIAGWLIGDIDEEIGRVWWFGPFVADGEWGAGASALYTYVRARLPDSIVQEEFAVDRHHSELIDWATGMGFVRETGSALLRLDAPDVFDVPAVRPIETGDHDVIAALHDQVFPGAHLTGSQLVQGVDDSHIRLVVEHDASVVGYVAAERQPDGEGYIDLLGVHPSHRRHGHGAELVGGAVAALRSMGCGSIHLTVRDNNEAAIGLYANLGFTKERVLVPLRKGFSYDASG